MQRYVLRRARLSVGLMLAFILLTAIIPVRAFVDLSMQLDVDQPTTVIGRTPIMTIRLVSSNPNPLRVNSLKCALTGSSIAQTSSYGLPTLNPGTTTLINVYYRAVAAGTTRIECTLVATDKVTGEPKTLVTSNEITVIGETRLFVAVYSATQVATVGQSVYVINKFGNRGNTPFTNVYLTCWYFGDALTPVVSHPVPSTLQPGQAGFTENRWLAAHPGRVRLDCTLTGTDSTGNEITIPAPPLIIEVR